MVKAIEIISSPLPGASIVLFAPHPDDETVGAGGYIASASQSGAQVWVVLVTDGNRRGLKRWRQRELKRALATLGVGETRLICLGYPDGRLKRQNLSGMRVRFEQVMSELKPTVVIAPFPQDNHSDHQVAGELAAAAAHDRGLILYQYLIHAARFPKRRRYLPAAPLEPPAQFQDLPGWRVFPLAAQVRQLKYEALKQYKTQLRVPFLRDLLLGMVRANELFYGP